jgi:iron complex transport system substrate-binding protein
MSIDPGPGAPLRIASLLPSATETVCALGLEESLVAVSHSCDFPGRIESLPRVTRTRVPGGAASREIDTVVREHLRRGESLYQLDEELLEALRPDMIVTQALCEVCAVGPAEVGRVIPALSRRPLVVTMEPHTLEEVFLAVETVGSAAGRPGQAAALVDRLRARVEAVRRRGEALARRPRVAFLEWADPLICGGHWNPELVALAGGCDGIGRAGEPGRVIAWADVLAWQPEVMVVACCGFDERRAREEIELLRAHPGFSRLPCARHERIYVMDGVRFFSRPGPGLVDSLERLAAILHD